MKYKVVHCSLHLRNIIITETVQSSMNVSISLCPLVKTQLMVPSLSLPQIRKVNLFSDEIFLTEICRVLENLPSETRSFLVKAAEMQVDS